MPQTPYNTVVGNKYQNIATAGTVTVKSGAGYLDSININNAGTTGVVTLYDNTAASGTKIGTIAVASGYLAPGAVAYNVNFNTGLTVITSGTSLDVTVCYR